MKMKFVAYLFIYLASLLFLAHATLPHHHHLKDVSIEITSSHEEECEAQKNHHEHNTDDLNHCELNHTLFIPQVTERGARLSITLKSPISLVGILMPSKNNLDNNKLPAIPLEHHLLSSPLQFPQLLSSPGLRAPPIA